SLLPTSPRSQRKPARSNFTPDSAPSFPTPRVTTPPLNPKCAGCRTNSTKPADSRQFTVDRRRPAEESQTRRGISWRKSRAQRGNSPRRNRSERGSSRCARGDRAVELGDEEGFGIFLCDGEQSPEPRPGLPGGLHARCVAPVALRSWAAAAAPSFRVPLSRSWAERIAFGRRFSCWRP